MRAERDDKEKSKGSVVVNVVIKQQEKETVDMRNMPMGVIHVVMSDEVAEYCKPVLMHRRPFGLSSDSGERQPRMLCSDPAKERN